MAIVESDDMAGRDIGVVTVLHKRMHQIDHFREDLGQ